MVEVDRSALQTSSLRPPFARSIAPTFAQRGRRWLPRRVRALARTALLAATMVTVSGSVHAQSAGSTTHDFGAADPAKDAFAGGAGDVAPGAPGPSSPAGGGGGSTGAPSGVTTGPQLEATVAGAPEPRNEDRAPEDPTMRKVVAERRNGLVLGVSPGFGLAASSGYPNDPKFIGNGSYYSSTPMLAGHATSFFLMGAFTDWVSFGPMVNVATFENATWKSTGFGVGFRLETFPLLRLFPTLADTSVYAQMGFGSAALRAKLDVPDSDGSQSFLGVGIHHEFRLARLLGGHAAIGPFVEYDAVFAKPIERHWLSIGVRIAWYGGKVTADRR